MLPLKQQKQAKKVHQKRARWMVWRSTYGVIRILQTQQHCQLQQKQK